MKTILSNDIINVKTYFYRDQEGIPCLGMIIYKEQEIIEIPKINIDSLEIDTKYEQKVFSKDENRILYVPERKYEIKADVLKNEKGVICQSTRGGRA